MNWTDQLNENELLALLPASAAKHSNSRDRAALEIGKDLAKKGLIPTQTVSIAIPRSAAKKVPTKPAKSAAKAAAKAKPFEKKSVQKKRPKYQGLWKGIKNEFHLLLCTNDKKYAAARKTLDKEGGKTTLTIVGTIAAAISPYVGTIAAACIPFVTMLLLVCLDVGRNAFCGTVST